MRKSKLKQISQKQAKKIKAEQMAAEKYRKALLEQAGMTEDELAWLG